ncbi:ArsA family ATPase [bacterium]|nr:ArsA family ATPase [bacterium]MBU1752388.1 ArsA family ATPase [bacterium]
MGLTGLKKDELKLILFGGKGGVGKTTCASSTALYLAEDFKTLLFSTDPAHSLADSLGQEIESEIKVVKGVKNLSVLQISAEKAFSEFKMRYSSQIRKILDTSTYLDEEDINSIFALPIPGVDEMMGFKTILDAIEEAEFDKYIVDTAPTGHALRLLTMPGLLDEWIKVMAKMRWKYKYMVTTFSGKYNPDDSDDFLLEMKRTVKRMEILLKSSERCEFVAVTIPEAMAILETERLVNTLNKYGMKVRQLVVNNVHESDNCEFCRKRRISQEGYISQIREKFKDLRIVIVPLQPQEVKDIDVLNNFKELLFER